MEKSDLKNIENFILNYNYSNFYIHSLKTIYNNLLFSDAIKNYSIKLNEFVFEIEFEIKDNLIRFEVKNDYFSMQINSIEQYFWAESNSKIDCIIDDIFSGNYKIKHYLNKNDKIIFLKFVWDKKNLKIYNIKYKYRIFNCRCTIIRIISKKGINLINPSSP